MSMAQYIMVYTHPTEGEKRFDLVPGRSYRIGSRPDNDLVIDQKDVSRRHAVLRVDDGSFHITDLDSKNGTFINGAKTASDSFNCGDMVHLSSARLVIVELGTGSYPTAPEAILRLDDDSEAVRTEETQKFRGEASMEDVVSLLETVATAVRRGAMDEPLTWAVERLGFDGAVVLYRDEKDSVAMICSAGDLGQLARKSGILTKLATDHKKPSASGTRVRQVSESGDDFLIATVATDHVLVVRYSGQPPAIGDLRSVIAAVDIVLGCSKQQRPGVAAASPDSSGGDRVTEVTGSLSIPVFGLEGGHPPPASFGGDDRGFDFEGVADLELADARDRFERWLVERTLAACDGNQSTAAQRLGLSRAGLFKKMRKMGL